ncbi:DJ-1/PfpI family protein [Acetivibrio ethanolgignens]|uniref:Glutamine amidotransferase n=1 Tax=Acetivibrio ethanolgignens TaxID=290052 RepID=A0A0V8QGF2_9FIRM|nr:DJ-1/PfpI family protein [Acetivibrio ethanolgignens]KSV59636.1 glutamine amidotransferase [Acetivibrio ethanolgignens]
MKATAILIYNEFCNFEISVLLEILALSQKPIVVFAKDKQAVRSEEGITILPDKSIHELDLENYDSLVLPGAVDIREAIENENILEFIRKFNKESIIIGAISVAPLLLLKSGVMGNRKFLAGVAKEDLYEEGFTSADLKNMIDWEENLKNPVPEGYILSDRIITAVSYDFIRWGVAFGRLLGIDIGAENFGLK